MLTIDKTKLSKEVSDKYSFVSNAFRHTNIKNAELDNKGEPKDEINIEIGDTKVSDFLPQIKLMRFSNEVNFSVRLKDEDTINTATVSTEIDKIIWDKGNIKIENYIFDEDEGGMKFVWYLKQKPLTNKVEFTIQSKGLDFFYQPELTPEEIAEGASRPENVVGSYAVYHSTKGGMNDINGKEYKTGKAFHIYRPHIIDANGAETWGILHIENGIYSVEIPQDFLDTAVYPIKSNDTFGYTTEGGTVQSLANNNFYGSKFTSPSGAEIVAKILNYSWSAASFKYKAVITNSSLAIITNGIAPEKTHAYNRTEWDHNTYSTQPTIATLTDYFLGFVFTPNGSATNNIYYDTGSENQGAIDSSNSYASPTDPTDATLSTKKFSIFAINNVGTLLATNQQSSDAVNYTLGTVGALLRAQKFTAGATGYVSRVYVPLLKAASPTDNVTAKIYSDSGGNPNIAIATASNSITAASISTAVSNYFEFQFDGSVQLNNGTSYWLVLSRSGAANNTNYYAWPGDGTAVYGVVKVDDGDSGWDGATGAKGLEFSIYATYTPSGGSAIKTINGLAKASVKTVNGLAIASVKTWNGLA